MNEPCIDTNVIIRLVTGDDPQRQADSATLFNQIEQGKITAFARVTVIADAVHVLASPRLYHLPRPQIAAILTRLVRLPRFKVKSRRTVLRGLALYAGSTTLDFGDTMILAAMEQQSSTVLYSYDHDFDKTPSVQRLEP